MKTFNPLITIVSVAILFSVAGCNNKNEGHNPFRSKITISCITLPDIDFNAKEIRIQCPATTTTFKLTISASPDVSWETSIQEADKQKASFSPQSGLGYSQAVLNVNQNPNTTERQFEILFYDSLNKSARKIIIEQAAAAPQSDQ